MLIFVSGGSASGKSALSERICCALPGEHIYIATMPVRGAEDERKVARHHALRAGRGFAATLEMPGRLGAVPPDAAVLFECLSTFTANRMFSGETSADWLETLWAEMRPLIARPGPTVIVSADVGEDGSEFDPLTEDYRRVLTGLGCRLCAEADAAVEAVCGRAVWHKGAPPEGLPFEKGAVSEAD